MVVSDEEWPWGSDGRDAAKTQSSAGARAVMKDAMPPLLRLHSNNRRFDTDTENAIDV